ncbi:MAG: M20/M25/M40 family metallo-hydrolase [Thermoleophilaceae bacterium]
MSTRAGTGAASAGRASTEEKQRLCDEFVRLCEIESPSRSERAMADAVTAELRAAGLEVEEDESGAETGADAGNLIARVPGTAGDRYVLLSAHLDTVPLAAPVEVVLQDGVYRNRNEAILGADNKAAVAVLLALARRLASNPGPVGVELVLTTCEELALQGAKALDRGKLRSEYGFVFDHASPIGELIMAAPTYYRLQARFRGQAAHAGIRPEDGRNAIAAAAAAIAELDLGRLDDQTTANVGTIEGGSSANVVAERCTVELEARSLDHDRATALATGMLDTIGAAATDADCDVETILEEQFRAYRLPRTSPPAVVAATALDALGIEHSHITTGGGSDANVFVAGGLPCLNVANGTARNHEPDESVTVDALHTMLDVAIAIVAASE